MSMQDFFLAGSPSILRYGSLLHWPSAGSLALNEVIMVDQRDFARTPWSAFRQVC
jgi:hypothetical protein